VLGQSARGSSTSNISVALGGIAAGAASPEAEFRRDGQRSLASRFHSGHALGLAADHLPGSERERKRLIAVEQAVEFSPSARFRMASRCNAC
jgi:hypothetical protein